MADFEHILKSYDIGDALDDIASAAPPAGGSAPILSSRHVPPLAMCTRVLDALIDDRHYGFFEHARSADWHAHDAARAATVIEVLEHRISG